MNKSINDLDTEAWYKQGWPWALIAIPLLTIIACSITIWIAYSTDDSLVVDDYYKKGLAINFHLDRVEQAKSLALTASIEIDHNSDLLLLELTSKKNSTTDINPPQSLTLSFSHPTLKNNDQKITLSLLSGNDYAAEIKNLSSAYWHISIEDSSQTWLLKSRWLYPENNSIVIHAKTIK